MNDREIFGCAICADHCPSRRQRSFAYVSGVTFEAARFRTPGQVTAVFRALSNQHLFWIAILLCLFDRLGRLPRVAPDQSGAFVIKRGLWKESKTVGAE